MVVSWLNKFAFFYLRFLNSHAKINAKTSAQTGQNGLKPTKTDQQAARPNPSENIVVKNIILSRHFSLSF